MPPHITREKVIVNINFRIVNIVYVVMPESKGLFRYSLKNDTEALK